MRRRALWRQAIDVVMPENVALIALNVAAYMTMQALFFRLVGSKQYDTTVYDKVDAARYFTARAAPSTRRAICDKAVAEMDGARAEASAERSARARENHKLLVRSVAPLVGVSSGAGLLSMLLAIALDRWKWAHTGLLLCVAGAFSTEVVIYFTVVKRYSIVGDYEILATMIRSRQKKECFDDNDDSQTPQSRRES